jgi:hypothetical protein
MPVITNISGRLAGAYVISERLAGKGQEVPQVKVNLQQNFQSHHCGNAGLINLSGSDGMLKRLPTGNLQPINPLTSRLR